MIPLDQNQVISLLESKLKSGDLVAFIGAGASRTYTDESRGITINGLPSASEMVTALAASKSYLNPAMPFDEAMGMIKKAEGNTELVQCLLDQINNPAVEPLPAHELLSQLPFSAFLTTNYDCLLEKALERQHKRSWAIVEDEDVSRWRFSQQLPIIKIHGCATRPNTLVAAKEDYKPLATSKPIVSALLTALLSNKTVLFLGFSLEDEDFRSLYDQIKDILKDNMPRSYAVCYGSSQYSTAFWGDKGVQIIEADLTAFLRKLLGSILNNSSPGFTSPDDDDWLNTNFLEKLHNIKNKPSETQVIDAFLSHLLDEIQSPVLTCTDVTKLANDAAIRIIERKPNLHAFRKIWNKLHERLNDLCKDGEDKKDAAEVLINEIIEQRRHKLALLGQHGRSIVRRNSNILLYSQSIQMLEVLKAVPRNIQSSCRLFVCECRPKSPSPFQDGAAICEYLKKTDYQMILVPDVIFGNLMARNQINFVMMGAHSVFTDNDNNFKSFVNTCGSSLILLAAEHYDKPVYIIAEDSKITKLNDGEVEEVSYEEEENIFGNCDVVSTLRANGLSNVTEKNIGYDLCLANKVTKLITLP